MRFLLIIVLSMQLMSQEISWTNNIPLVTTFSSPRTTDLNNDGIEDIILGGGIDGQITPFGVIAVDGLNGNTIWTMETRNEMFNSPQFFDYNEDGIDDILIGGRDAELRLISGANGDLIWEFWDNETNPNDEGWYNFYTSQIIEDQTGDGFPDILAANGGDHSILDTENPNRPPGHIMIIDGFNGSAFKTAVVPDSNETYLSPVICDLNGDGNCSIIFGTGGEGIQGNLWISNLTELLDENLSNAIPLIPNSELGHIAPPVIGDLDLDGVKDIITQGFDGKVSAINGSDFNLIWQYAIDNTESSASPILGVFSNDGNLDVFATIFSGILSSYNDYYQVLIDGQTGTQLWIDSIGDINYATPIAFDSNGDGQDEPLISVMNNNGISWEDELILIDFSNNSQTTLIGPIASGNIASTPQIKDTDNDNLLDIIFATQANSLDPFDVNGTSIDDGINIMKITTNFTTPITGVAWGSYMGTNFDGQYGESEGCAHTECVEGDLGLFAFPSASCPGENNAMINLYPSGGTPPYTYIWSNGDTTEDIEDIGPGIYSATVIDSNGICETITAEVNEYIIVSSYTPPSCPGENDGVVNVNSSECGCNTSFCQFIWELNGDTIAQGDGSSAAETYKQLTNIGAGIYTATIIHPNGCEVQEEIIVPEPELVNDIQITHDCLANGGGSIELISDNVSIDYNWNTQETTPMIQNLNAGIYSVIISTTLCTDTVTFEIEDYFPYDCEGECINDDDGDGVCDELEVFGCNDEEADNYNPDATEDDGSCEYWGCIDEEADNYCPDCNVDDDSCIYVGCTDEEADNYCPDCNVDDDSCIYVGCTDPNANNYCEECIYDDGSCEYWGCMDEEACNYEPIANVDDGSCIFIMFFCLDVNADGCGNSCAGDYFQLDFNDDDAYDGCMIVCDESELPTLDLPGWPNATWANNDDCYGESIVNNDSIMEHHWCTSINENISTAKRIIMSVDMLGRRTTNNTGFQLKIYDDGSVEKKYFIK